MSTKMHFCAVKHDLYFGAIFTLFNGVLKIVQKTTISTYLRLMVEQRINSEV